MADNEEIPVTMNERFKQIPKDLYKNRAPNAPEWFDKEYNRKQIKPGLDQFCWAAPHDIRFPQTKAQHHCYAYFTDYHRCLELLGHNYEPCKFFKIVYEDICPSAWIKEWEGYVAKGNFMSPLDH